MNAAEYARHRGVSKMRVSQYIASGMISATKIGRGYEIDPALADRELGGSIDQSHPAPKPKLTVLPAPPKEPPKPINPDQSLVDDTKPGRDSIKNGPTYADAQRAREVYRAERERLKLMQEKGELVPAADVKKEVMTLTRTIRDNMMSIPDRVASQLAALTDIHQVHHLLDDEIRTALRMLANG
jgi:hypothetical protein